MAAGGRPVHRNRRRIADVQRGVVDHAVGAVEQLEVGVVGLRAGRITLVAVLPGHRDAGVGRCRTRRSDGRDDQVRCRRRHQRHQVVRQQRVVRLARFVLVTVAVAGDAEQVVALKVGRVADRRREGVAAAVGAADGELGDRVHVGGVGIHDLVGAGVQQFDPVVPGRIGWHHAGAVVDARPGDGDRLAQRDRRRRGDGLHLQIRHDRGGDLQRRHGGGVVVVLVQQFVDVAVDVGGHPHPVGAHRQRVRHAEGLRALDRRVGGQHRRLVNVAQLRGNAAVVDQPDPVVVVMCCRRGALVGHRPGDAEVLVGGHRIGRAQRADHQVGHADRRDRQARRGIQRVVRFIALGAVVVDVDQHPHDVVAMRQGRRGRHRETQLVGVAAVGTQVVVLVAGVLLIGDLAGRRVDELNPVVPGTTARRPADVLYLPGDGDLLAHRRGSRCRHRHRAQVERMHREQVRQRRVVVLAGALVDLTAVQGRGIGRDAQPVLAAGQRSRQRDRQRSLTAFTSRDVVVEVGAPLLRRGQVAVGLCQLDQVVVVAVAGVGGRVALVGVGPLHAERNPGRDAGRRDDVRDHEVGGHVGQRHRVRAGQRVVALIQLGLVAVDVGRDANAVVAVLQVGAQRHDERLSDRHAVVRRQPAVLVVVVVADVGLAVVRPDQPDPVVPIRIGGQRTAAGVGDGPRQLRRLTGQQLGRQRDRIDHQVDLRDLHHRGEAVVGRLAGGAVAVLVQWVAGQVADVGADGQPVLAEHMLIVEVHRQLAVVDHDAGDLAPQVLAFGAGEAGDVRHANRGRIDGLRHGQHDRTERRALCRRVRIGELR